MTNGQIFMMLAVDLQEAISRFARLRGCLLLMLVRLMLVKVRARALVPSERLLVLSGGCRGAALVQESLLGRQSPDSRALRL